MLRSGSLDSATLCQHDEKSCVKIGCRQRGSHRSYLRTKWDATKVRRNPKGRQRLWFFDPLSGLIESIALTCV